MIRFKIRKSDQWILCSPIKWTMRKLKLFTKHSISAADILMFFCFKWFSIISIGLFVSFLSQENPFFERFSWANVNFLSILIYCWRSYILLLKDHAHDVYTRVFQKMVISQFSESTTSFIIPVDDGSKVFTCK